MQRFNLNTNNPPKYKFDNPILKNNNLIPIEELKEIENYLKKEDYHPQIGKPQRVSKWIRYKVKGGVFYKLRKITPNKYVFYSHVKPLINKNLDAMTDTSSENSDFEDDDDFEFPTQQDVINMNVLSDLDKSQTFQHYTNYTYNEDLSTEDKSSSSEDFSQKRKRKPFSQVRELFGSGYEHATDEDLIDNYIFDD